jgi:hypothetical protein
LFASVEFVVENNMELWGDMACDEVEDKGNALGVFV